MARNKVDLCIFCGEAPCACNKPVKQAPKPRPKKVEPEGPIVEDRGLGLASEQPAPAKKSSFLSAMKDAAKLAPPPPPEPPKPAPRVQVNHRQPVNEDEALFAAAVRALEPLLAPAEKEKYRVILTSSPTNEERLVVWKAQRRFDKEG